MGGLRLKLFDEKTYLALKMAEEFCRNVEVFQVSHSTYMVGYETFTSILIAYK